MLNKLLDKLEALYAADKNRPEIVIQPPKAEADYPEGSEILYVEFENKPISEEVADAIIIDPIARELYSHLEGKRKVVLFAIKKSKSSIKQSEHFAVTESYDWNHKTKEVITEFSFGIKEC